MESKKLAAASRITGVTGAHGKTNLLDDDSNQGELEDSKSGKNKKMNPPKAAMKSGNRWKLETKKGTFS